MGFPPIFYLTAEEIVKVRTNKLCDKGSSKDPDKNLSCLLQFWELKEHTYFTKYFSWSLLKPEKDTSQMY